MFTARVRLCRAFHVDRERALGYLFVNILSAIQIPSDDRRGSSPAAYEMPPCSRHVGRF
jgi:hypothetical protein